MGYECFIQIPVILVDIMILYVPICRVIVSTFLMLIKSDQLQVKIEKRKKWVPIEGTINKKTHPASLPNF